MAGSPVPPPNSKEVVGIAGGGKGYLSMYYTTKSGDRFMYYSRKLCVPDTQHLCDTGGELEHNDDNFSSVLYLCFGTEGGGRLFGAVVSDCVVEHIQNASNSESLLMSLMVPECEIHLD